MFSYYACVFPLHLLISVSVKHLIANVIDVPRSHPHDVASHRSPQSVCLHSLKCIAFSGHEMFCSTLSSYPMNYSRGKYILSYNSYHQIQRGLKKCNDELFKFFYTVFGTNHIKVYKTLQTFTQNRECFMLKRSVIQFDSFRQSNC